MENESDVTATIFKKIKAAYGCSPESNTAKFPESLSLKQLEACFAEFGKKISGRGGMLYLGLMTQQLQPGAGWW